MFSDFSWVNRRLPGLKPSFLLVFPLLVSCNTISCSKELELIGVLGTDEGTDLFPFPTSSWITCIDTYWKNCCFLPGDGVLEMTV